MSGLIAVESDAAILSAVLLRVCTDDVSMVHPGECTDKTAKHAACAYIKPPALCL